MSETLFDILNALILTTIFCGFLGIILKPNLIMKIFSMDIMSTGVIAYYVLISARNGLFTPILSVPVIGPGQDSSSLNTVYADPVPQAVILTAIVIGFSIQALMLVGVMKLSRTHPSLDVRDIEKAMEEEHSS